MEKEILLKNRLDRERKNILNKNRACLYPNCNNEAIGSHVLQKEILKGIVDSTNHFYALEMIDLFKMEKSGAFKIDKVGIRDGYKFPGFCNPHDMKVFKEIETHPVNLNNRRIQELFSYRTLCLEFRKQQMYLETVQSIASVVKELEPDKIHYVDLRGAQNALKDLEFFKKEIEFGLLNNGISNFKYRMIELPETSVCFSAAITVFDKGNPNAMYIDEYGFPRDEPLSLSI